MAPKPELVYSRKWSKSVAPSCRMLIGSSKDEHDSEYVPPRSQTPTRAARNTLGRPIKVASSVVTASQSNDERKLTGAPYRSTSNS